MNEWNVQIPHHDLTSMDKTPRKGRNPYEGYARACGFQFGNLADLCRQDDDFKRAVQIAQGHTIVSPLNLMNLFMLFKFFLPKIERGHIAEFGSYRGGSAMFMAYLAQRFLGGAYVYAFDTYQGMPPTDRQVDAHKAGEFGGVNIDNLRKYAASVGLSNLLCIQGRFEDTAPQTLRDAGRLALVHIDCDIYSAVAYSYDTAKEFLVKGGYIVLDDPLTGSCLGACEAMEELMVRRDGLHAEQMMPHPVFRFPKLPEAN
jgi:hypothetical protein